VELQAEGYFGHLTEISRFLEEKNNAWLDSKGKGDHGWEEVPYWLKGYINLAYLLEDQKMIDRGHKWVEDILSSQRENGWFGPVSSNTEIFGDKKTEGTASRGAKFDLWPNMVALFALQSYYEHTGDERVIELMRDYFKWQTKLTDEQMLPPYWQRMRGGDNLWSIYWIYNRTGDEWLLNLAERINKSTANWDRGVVSMHNVNIAQAFDTPGIYYQQAGEDALLEQVEENYREIR